LPASHRRGGCSACGRHRPSPPGRTRRSFAVTADLDVPAKGAEGVMIAQSGRFGGWSLYATGGKAKFVYNVLGIKSYEIEIHQSHSGRKDADPHGVRL
jgi:hypothetical protein